MRISVLSGTGSPKRQKREAEKIQHKNQIIDRHKSMKNIHRFSPLGLKGIKRDGIENYFYNNKKEIHTKHKLKPYPTLKTNVTQLTNNYDTKYQDAILSKSLNEKFHANLNKSKDFAALLSEMYAHEHSSRKHRSQNLLFGTSINRYKREIRPPHRGSSYQHYNGAYKKDNLFDDPALYLNFVTQAPGIYDKYTNKDLHLTEKPETSTKNNAKEFINHTSKMTDPDRNNHHLSSKRYEQKFHDYQQNFRTNHHLIGLNDFFTNTEYFSSSTDDETSKNSYQDDFHKPTFYPVYDDESIHYYDDVLNDDNMNSQINNNNKNFEHGSKHSIRSTKQRSISIFPPSASSLSDTTKESKGAVLPPNYLEGVWEPEDFTLQIKFAERADAGTYICQINTEPRMSQTIHVNVIGTFITSFFSFTLSFFKNILSV